MDDSEGCSYGQLMIGSFITTMHQLMHHIPWRVFWQNMRSPRWLSLLSAQIWCPVTSGFSQNWNHLWKEKISDHKWDPGKHDRAADGNWENCVRPQDAYFEGDCGIIVLYMMFLVSCIFNNCLFFILHGWILSGQTSFIFEVRQNHWNIKLDYRVGKK